MYDAGRSCHRIAMTTQIRCADISSPPSDQGAIVVNCYEDVRLGAVRRITDNGTSETPTPSGNTAFVYLIKQNELVFTTRHDKRTIAMAGGSDTKQIAPFVFTSFNEMPKDEEPVFVGVADHTSANHNSISLSNKSVIPVCLGGLRAINNNSTEPVYPGDILMWDNPPTVDNQGKKVPLLRHRTGHNNKFTAGIRRLDISSNGAFDCYHEMRRFEDRVRAGGDNPLGQMVHRGVSLAQRLARVQAGLNYWFGCHCVATGQQDYYPIRLNMMREYAAVFGPVGFAAHRAAVIASFGGRNLTEEQAQFCWGEPLGSVAARLEEYLNQNGWTAECVNISRAQNFPVQFMVTPIFTYALTMEIARVISRVHQEASGRIIGKAARSSVQGGIVDLLVK